MDTDVSNHYIAENGSGMEFVSEDTSQYWYIFTKDNIKYSFSKDGNLKFITNLVTEKTLSIYYTYAEHLYYIEDEEDNRIQFYYDSSWKTMTGTELKLKQLDGSYRVVEEKKYFYDSCGNIDRIEQGFNYGTESSTMVAGDTLQYTFYPYYPHLLSEAYNESDNYKVYYHYDSNRRIDYFELKDTLSGSPVILGNTSIQYLPNKTIYTDYEGNYVNYIFDNWGHTVNVIDSYGNAIFWIGYFN